MPLNCRWPLHAEGTCREMQLVWGREASVLDLDDMANRAPATDYRGVIAYHSTAVQPVLLRVSKPWPFGLKRACFNGPSFSRRFPDWLCLIWHWRQIE